MYHPEWLSINILPEDLKESIWKDIKSPLASLENKRGLEQIESEMWKEIDSQEFNRLSAKFAHHIQWISWLRNLDPVKLLEQGCPELVEWYTENV